VGWIKNAGVGRLNGAAHRDLIQLQKIIKTGNDTFAPGVGQVSCDPFFQGAEPMALAGAVNAG